jgi:hypothetical protein
MLVIMVSTTLIGVGRLQWTADYPSESTESPEPT